tara:strand:- start:156 stop:1703 length:1548 start_codon:yes stop_codon:yes gene_type:complete
MKTKKIIEFSIIFVLSLISLLFNYYFGSIGVFPVDTFAHFDSGFSILNGFLPFRDYWTISGPIIDLFQSVLFYLFGTNWLVYNLHAGLINTLLACVSFLFFKKIKLNLLFSFLLTLSVIILGYSTIGAPFSDYHSAIFSVIATLFLIFNILEKNYKYIYWVPIFYFIAFFSKQTPAVYSLILNLPLIFFTIFYNKDKKFLIILTIITLSLICLLFIFLYFSKINLQSFFIQYFLFPSTIGESRLDLLKIDLINFLNNFKFILIPLFFMIFLLAKNFKKILDENVVLIYFYLFSLTSSLILHQLLTKNQIFIFFIIPLLFGYIFSQLFILKKYEKVSKIIFIILIFIITCKYHLRFNIDRKFIELENLNTKNYEDSTKINNKLSGLKWVTPSYNENVLYEINLIKESLLYLNKFEGKTIVITYYQFFSSILNKNLYSPNRWYTRDGVSYPLLENKYHDFYKTFYSEKIKNLNLKTIHTIKPLDDKIFKFIFNTECIKTIKINDILNEHNIERCKKN